MAGSSSRTVRLRTLVAAIAVLLIGIPSPVKADLSAVDSEPGSPEGHAHIQDATAKALDWFASQSHGAGAYYDRENGHTPVFLVTHNVAETREQLSQLIPAEIDFKVRGVELSSAELTALKYQVVAQWDELRRMGIPVISTGIDTQRNQVVVGVEGMTTDHEAAISSLFPVAVRSEPASRAHPDCTAVNCGSPMKGGLEIVWVQNNVYRCTSGWNIRRNSTYYVLTAGHCLSKPSFNVSDTWRHSSTVVGSEVESSWANGADGDAGLLTVSLAQPRNQFYAGSSTSTVRSVTGIRALSGQVQGADVCRHGMRSGYDCGFIWEIDQTLDVDDRLIDHQWVVADFVDGLPGDSGGPYFYGTVAWGIHSDSNDVAPYRSWYTPMTWALLVLQGDLSDVGLCVTASC